MNPLTEMFLTWTLLGVLLAWMLLCAVLALRPRRAEQRETTDLLTPSGVFSANLPRTPLRRPVSSVDVSFGNVPTIANEASNEVSVAPVA